MQACHHKSNTSIILCVTLVLCLIVGVKAYIYRAELYSDFNNRLKLMAVRLAHSLPEYVWNFQSAQYKETVALEMQSPDIKTILVWGGANTLLVVSVKDANNQINNVNNVNQLPEDVNNSIVQQLMYQVDDKMLQIGQVVLYPDDRHVLMQIKNYLMREIIAIIVLDIILAFFLSICNRRNPDTTHIIDKL